jgi:hypothetical protein
MRPSIMWKKSLAVQSRNFPPAGIPARSLVWQRVGTSSGSRPCSEGYRRGTSASSVSPVTLLMVPPPDGLALADVQRPAWVFHLSDRRTQHRPTSVVNPSVRSGGSEAGTTNS